MRRIPIEKKSTSRIETYKKTVIVLFTAVIVSIFSILYLDRKNQAISRNSELLSGTVVGTASVASNPINRLAGELRAKEASLSEREKSIEKGESRLKEIILDGKRQILAYLIIVAIVLLSLILLNFYFDFKRSAAKEKNDFSLT